MTINEFNPGLFRIELDDTVHLGIGIGPAHSRYATKALSSRQEHGQIYDPQTNSMTSWPIEGVCTYHETIIAYGPWKEGAQSGVDLLGLEQNKALGILSNLTQSYAKLAVEKKLSQRGLYIDGFLLFPDNSFIILPMMMQEAMLALSALELKKQRHEIYRLSSASLADSYAFGLAVLAFRIATGVFPFETSLDSAQTSSLIAHGVAMTPRCLIPGIDEEIEAVCNRFLVKHEFGSDSLSEIGATIERWRASPIQKVLSNVDYSQSAGKSFSRRLKGHQGRRFIQRNGLRITFITIAGVLILSIPGTMLANYFRPLKTKGMNPTQVIQAFYSAYNSLDTSLMSDATNDDAAKKTIEMLSNIFVIDRVRFASEHRQVHFTPEELRQKPELTEIANTMIYGIDQLSITEDMAAETGNAKVFIAAYDLWSNIGNNSPDAENQDLDLPKAPVIMHKVEQLFLWQRDDGIWKIKEIKNLTKNEDNVGKTP